MLESREGRYKGPLIPHPPWGPAPCSGCSGLPKGWSLRRGCWAPRKTGKPQPSAGALDPRPVLWRWVGRQGLLGAPARSGDPGRVPVRSKPPGSPARPKALGDAAWTHWLLCRQKQRWRRRRRHSSTLGGLEPYKGRPAPSRPAPPPALSHGAGPSFRCPTWTARLRPPPLHPRSGALPSPHCTTLRPGRVCPTSAWG